MIQRLLLKIQHYDVVIKCVPGIKIPMADALSRVRLQEKGDIKGLDVSIHVLTPQLTRVHAEHIQKTIQGGKTIHHLIQQMLEG